MNPSFLRSRRALAAVAVAGAAVLLAGCASLPSVADAEPVETAAPVEVPVAEPDVPDPDAAGGSAEFWLAGLASSYDYLRTSLGEWDGRGCTVDAAIDGEYLCTGALTSATMAAATIDEMFAAVEDHGLAAGQLDELAPVREAAAVAGDAATVWTGAECNWEATPECTPAAEDALSTSVALLAALDAWAA